MAWGQCNKFCCSDVCKYRDAFPTKLPNLTNPIHPIFQQDAFDPNIDYSLLEVSLRLASRYLTLGKVAHNICVVVDGVQTVYTDSIGDHIVRSATDEHCQPPKNADDYTHYIHWRANEILRGAMGKNHFHILPNTERGGKSKPRIGSFIPALPLYQRGFPCDVYIGGYMYRQVQSLNQILDLQGHLSGPDLAELLYCHFELARLLIHELLHSIKTLYNGVRRWEHHCSPDALLSEGGYDIEAAIFGGDGMVSAAWSKDILLARRKEYCTKGQLRTAPRVPTVLFYNWPSRGWLDMYRSRRHKMGVINGEKLKCTTVENVPFSFIEELLQEGYWVTTSKGKRTPLEKLNVPRKGRNWGVMWNWKKDTLQPWLSKAECAVGKAANE
ncbi:hypothetical protein Slin15195_G053060 [Septoria linicola]|uniref:Uncharacterized protein n=1 Tax=Septoria linicola TaxID=215465 RepID=A0A9Q9AU15_9PEZI|nr:hypothetical protein Slin15195_G053060 [Septoria linicola]